MEGTPKIEQTKDTPECVEYAESLERAKELQDQLEQFNGQDIVGLEACRGVENVAKEYNIHLQKIPPHVRQENGLHYHPLEDTCAANDENVAVAA